MCNTKLGNFCKLHNNWRELLVEEPYCLKIKEDGDYVIFNYDQIRSDFNNSIVREARGIIFKKDEWKNPVCWAFNKFGNYGESYVPEIDWSTAFVTEKIDGSLIKVWWDWEGGWHISTNGTIDAVKAQIQDIKVSDFGTYFCNAVEKYYGSFDEFTECLEHDFTYMFELVGPYNRVVTPYDISDLYFLGARNKFSGTVLNCTGINATKLGVGDVKVPESYMLTSLDECIKIAEKLTWDQEGFVVVDANDNRVKVKSPAYVKAHFARNNNVITRKHLINVILSNEVEEFLCYAADYKEQLDHCIGLKNTFIRLGDTFAAAGRRACGMSRRDYASMVQCFPKIYHGLMFANYEKDCYAAEWTIDWSEDKWERYLDELERYLESLKV